MKLMRIPQQLAETHYEPHKGKPFYAGAGEVHDQLAGGRAGAGRQGRDRHLAAR